MKTDFGGRSLSFSNDPTLTEYQPLVQSVIDVLGPASQQGSLPEQVAGIIYAAATDQTDQLRYEAGADATELLASRRALDDSAFFAEMKAQFRLGK